MPDGLAILFIIVFGVLFLAFAIVAYNKQKKRRAALSELATRHGFEFSPGNDHTFDDRHKAFGTFTRGSNRYAYNVLRGAVRVEGASWRIEAGDFHYRTTSHNGKQTQHHSHHLSFMVLETPHLAAPHLRIRAEGILDKLIGAIGFDDIDFESAEFSRKFHVSCTDKRFAYDIVHPRMMEFLLGSDAPAIEIIQGRACLTRGERCWSPEQFADAIAWAPKFFELWPRHVGADLFNAIENNEGQKG